MEPSKTPKKESRRILRRSKTLKENPDRFSGVGVDFRAKIIGTERVVDARGNRMCQGALQRLKAAVKASGEHKQRILLNISLEGIILKEEKSGVVLHHHPIHKISFISQDTADSRAFGYVFGCPQNGHDFFAIKTDKMASHVVVTLRDLFLTALDLKKKEMEEKPEEEEVPAPENGPTSEQTGEHPQEEAPAVDTLLDLQFSVDSLKQGISHMDQSIARGFGFSLSEDDTSDSVPFHFKIDKLSSLYQETLSLSSRSSSTSECVRDVSSEHSEPDRYAVFLEDIDALPSVFDAPLEPQKDPFHTPLNTEGSYPEVKKNMDTPPFAALENAEFSPFRMPAVKEAKEVSPFHVQENTQNLTEVNPFHDPPAKRNSPFHPLETKQDGEAFFESETMKKAEFPSFNAPETKKSIDASLFNSPETKKTFDASLFNSPETKKTFDASLFHPLKVDLPPRKEPIAFNPFSHIPPALPPKKCPFPLEEDPFSDLPPPGSPPPPPPRLPPNSPPPRPPPLSWGASFPPGGAAPPPPLPSPQRKKPFFGQEPSKPEKDADDIKWNVSEDHKAWKVDANEQWKRNGTCTENGKQSRVDTAFSKDKMWMEDATFSDNVQWKNGAPFISEDSKAWENDFTCSKDVNVWKTDLTGADDVKAWRKDATCAEETTPWKSNNNTNIWKADSAFSDDIACKGDTTSIENSQKKDVEAVPSLPTLRKNGTNDVPSLPTLRKNVTNDVPSLPTLRKNVTNDVPSPPVPWKHVTEEVPLPPLPPKSSSSGASGSSSSYGTRSSSSLVFSSSDEGKGSCGEPLVSSWEGEPSPDSIFRRKGDPFADDFFLTLSKRTNGVFKT